MEEGLKIRIGAVITGVTEAINSIKASLSGLQGPIAKAQGAFVLFNKVLLGSVIGVIVIALAKLVQVFKENETAQKKLQPLLIGLERILGGIFRAFEPVLDAFIEMATKALPYITKGVGILYSSLYGLFTLLKQAGQGAGKILKGIFTLDKGLIDSGVKQLGASVIVSVDAAVKAFDRYEVGLTDLTETEKKLRKKAQKDAEKAQREADAILKDSLNARKELLEGEVKKVGNLTDEYLRLKKEIRTIDFRISLIGKKGGQSDLKKAFENDIKDITDEFRAGKFSAGKIDYTSFFELDFEGIREKAKQYGLIASNAFAEAAKLSSGKLNNKVTITPTGDAKASIDAQKELEQRVLNTTNAFNNFLAPAIEVVYGALANGGNIFKALGQGLKALVVQMGLAIAKALVLSAILAAVTGGGSAAGGGFLKTFTGLLSKGLGGSAAPNLGGIGRGGLELAGQVVFRQSGPDLVGVLNSGNAQIRRTG